MPTVGCFHLSTGQEWMQNFFLFFCFFLGGGGGGVGRFGRGGLLIDL